METPFSWKEKGDQSPSVGWKEADGSFFIGQKVKLTCTPLYAGRKACLISSIGRNES
jgi:hypothetical protein